MATGTGNLPNQGMDFTPFDVLTAEEMDDLVENIESLADGSGIGDEAVTPAKRSGGFKIGVIPGSTFGTTGNKSITGVGFKPKLVRFTLIPSASSINVNMGMGAMTAASQYYAAWASASGFSARNSSTSACIAWHSTTNSTPSLLASYVSMDADGFTINVSTASSIFDVAYECYA